MTYDEAVKNLTDLAKKPPVMGLPSGVQIVSQMVVSRAAGLTFEVQRLDKLTLDRILADEVEKAHLRAALKEEQRKEDRHWQLATSMASAVVIREDRWRNRAMAAEKRLAALGR